MSGDVRAHPHSAFICRQKKKNLLMTFDLVGVSFKLVVKKRFVHSVASSSGSRNYYH